MSFNKNNPNAMGKIMGYLKQISTEMKALERTLSAHDAKHNLTVAGLHLDRVVDAGRCLATNVDT